MSTYSRNQDAPCLPAYCSGHDILSPLPLTWFCPLTLWPHLALARAADFAISNRASISFDGEGAGDATIANDLANGKTKELLHQVAPRIWQLYSSSASI